MPVGNADNGIGLWAGQVMLSTNYNLQYIDWSHEQILGENFKHDGNLITNLISPTITIGLSDYLNISYQQVLGIRSMDWYGSQESEHHRDEHSLSDFLNARGSIFGDANIKVKYLLANTGALSGSRIFLGAGLTIPSNSVLTSNPFEQSIDGTALNEHRHFSLSEGVYKSNFELQYYIKQTKNKKFLPSFYGITYNYINPISENEYGYLPGNTNSIIGSVLFATKLKNKWSPKGLSFGLMYAKTDKAYWNNTYAPYSDTEVIIPTIGLIFNNMDYGSFSLNLKFNINNGAIPETAPDSEVSVIELSIGYRKTLDYVIPWLYY